MNNFETQVKAIVSRSGGFREREVMKSAHTIEKSDTWNDEHKVLEVLEVIPQADGYRIGFAVDLVTKSICG